MFVGNTAPSLRLEAALAEALDATHVALFSSGWGAGFGTITGLVRPADHVVMDVLSHACLQSGAAAATRNVHRFRHLQNDEVREKLMKIRSRDADNGMPSAVVPVPSGDTPTARIAGRMLAGRHVFANLVEFPAVPLKGSRFRMQVMAMHTAEQVREAAATVADTIEEARAFVHGDEESQTAVAAD